MRGHVDSESLLRAGMLQCVSYNLRRFNLLNSMSFPPPTPPKEYFIQGVTQDGKAFRPSDWSERLCGVMSQFRPEGSGGMHAHLGYSPYVRPIVTEGVKGVVVDERLRELEPKALEFVLGFAKENNLVMTEICTLPDFKAS